MKKHFLSSSLVLMLSAAIVSNAAAHFPWLISNQQGNAVYFFGEGLADRAYKLPPSIAEAKIFYIDDQGSTQSVDAEMVEQDDLVGLVSTESIPAGSLLASKATFGIYHGSRLDYYTLHKSGELPAQRESQQRVAQEMDLFAEAISNNNGVDLFVTWKGKPLADAEVHLYCAEGLEEGTATTDADGKVSFSDAQVEEGINAIMVGHKVKEAGKLKDATYDNASHYLTMTFFDPKQSKSDNSQAQLAPLPFEITSFGAVRSGDAIYVYGGHTGSAHSYSTEAQSDKLLVLDLANPGSKWQEIASGQKLQGLGMVAHKGKLILIGGFTAMNAEGDEHDLHSQAAVNAYDPKTNSWSELPALPEARSSHDAAIIGDTIYVVGGWAMNGDDETTWHKTAWSMDLSANNPKWTALPEPPFVRRALATVAHNGKLFVIGGMNEKGGPTKEVVVYDPELKSWNKAGDLLGEQSMAGFGASGWSINGKLIVTTYEGDIQAWDEQANSWKQLGKTEDARFFHRLVPLDAQHLVSIGGANMEEGKYLKLEPVAAK